jgi:hypothetical protein
VKAVSELGGRLWRQWQNGGQALETVSGGLQLHTSTSSKI